MLVNSSRIRVYHRAPSWEPFLFTIYINIIIPLLLRSNVHVYADDTTLYCVMFIHRSLHLTEFRLLPNASRTKLAVRLSEGPWQQK